MVLPIIVYLDFLAPAFIFNGGHIRWGTIFLRRILKLKLMIPFFAQPCSMANDDIAHKQTPCLHYRSSSRASASSGPPSLLKFSPFPLVCPEKKWKWYPRGILVGSKDRHNLLSDSARRDCWGNQRALLPFKPILQLLLPASWSPPSPKHRRWSYQGW